MAEIADMLQVCMGKKEVSKDRHVRRYKYARRLRKKKKKQKTNAQKTSLRLGKLLLTEEEQEASTDQELTEQSDPEPGVSQGVGAESHIRGNGTGACGIGAESSGADGRDGTKHLGCNECETHVNSRESLQKNDTKAETLD